ncbi:MAG: hypothetical protein KGL39_19815 [Patescibacteria group bacterium]|nr:hypothetical protein [Patescibacteria group bacterium]
MEQTIRETFEGVGNVNLEAEVDRVIDEMVTPLMCAECGFSVVGHTCRIPGACESFKSSPLDGGK